MANVPRISDAAANAACNAVVDLLDAGSPPGFLEIYNTGSGRPAKPEDSAAGCTLLAQLTLANPAFASATGGSASADTITADSSANADGTASWFRLRNQAGTGIIDGEVGTSGSDLNLNTVDIQQGANVSVTSFVYTQQKGWT